MGKPVAIPDPRVIEQKATAAIRSDLHDYDWMTIDPDLARRIHALLYARPRKR